MLPRRVLVLVLSLLAGSCTGRLPLGKEPVPVVLPRSLRVVGPGGRPEQLTLGVPLRLSAGLLERVNDSTHLLRAGAIPGAEGVRILTAGGRVRAIHFDLPGGAAGDSALIAMRLGRLPAGAPAGSLEMEGSSVTWWEDERTKLLTSTTEYYGAVGAGRRRSGMHYVLLDRRLSGH